MLKKLIAATLYTALSFGAIPATALDRAAVEELLSGSMQKLGFHAEPKAVSALPFADADGNEMLLSDYQGHWVLLNFWATWCAPCLKEMPSLNALAKEFSDQGLVVLPIASGHNPRPAIDKFYATAEITDLPLLTDAKGAMTRDMAVLGLPVSILISPEGQEVARMTGDAEWYSASARALIAKLIADSNATD